MTLPSCVATHRLFDETIAHLAPHCQLTHNSTDGSWTREELIGRCANAQALIAFMPDLIDEAFVQACPNLRVVAAALKGYDNIDLDACARHGVTVSIVPDHLTNPTAELAIGLTIGLARHIRRGDLDVRSGAFRAWRPTLYGMGLEGSTVGLLGYGRIGRAIAKRLNGFDCRLLAADRLDVADQMVALRCPLELAAESDILIVCVPLTLDTRHWINREFLEVMPNHALLINPARGSVVDEKAVAEAIKDKRLGGYAADVFEFEDWALPDRPLKIEPELAAMTEQTLFSPHLGSATIVARKAIERTAANNVIDVLQGRSARNTITSEAAP